MTARTLVVFLPADPAAPLDWRLWTADGPTDGVPLDTPPPPADDLAVHAVAAPEAVALHRITLPALAPNQARAAAALLAAEASAAPPAALHVALGRQEADGTRLIAVVDPALMAAWLAAIAATGHRPARLHAAPLLLPEPAADTACRGMVGPFAVLRTADGGSADDALGRMVLGTRPVTPVAATPLPAALLDGPLDLLQGRFSRRERRIDAAGLRRMARLAAVALLLVLVTQLVLIARHHLAAGAAETRTAQVAAAALPGTGPAGEAALTRRLAVIEGPGGGFAALATPVLQTLATAPGIDLTQLDFTEGGDLRITLVAADAAQLSAVANAIQARGVRVVLGDSGPRDGRTAASFTVTVR